MMALRIQTRTDTWVRVPESTHTIATPLRRTLSTLQPLPNNHRNVASLGDLFLSIGRGYFSSTQPALLTPDMPQI